MKTVQARTVNAGGTFLHPDTKMPLRVVQPQNFNTDLGNALAVNNKVFAVDDEGGLYAFDADLRVQVPFNVPLVTQASSDNYLIVVTFERQRSDDLPVMEWTFKKGQIKADPHKDFALAAMQQLSLELQTAYDDGMGGSFQSHHTIEGRAFNRQAMGYRRRS